MAKCYRDLLHLSFKQDLKKIDTPVLFIFGKHDSVLKKFSGTQLYNIIPNGKTIAFAGDHFVSHHHPISLAKLIMDFVSKEATS